MCFQQVEHYRRKLMKKSLRELQQDSPLSGRTSSLKRSPSPTDSVKRMKKSKRSPSPLLKGTRRRSRSPGYSKKTNRDSLSPASKYRTKRRSSRSRSSSLSPKRYRDRSVSPSSRSTKHDSSRRYNRLFNSFKCPFNLIRISFSFYLRSPSPVSAKSSRHLQMSPSSRYSTSKRRKHHH